MARPKIIKAGGGERGQFILWEFNDNTVRFVLNYPGIVDVDVLRKAIKAVVESADVLHGTFFTEGISAHWKLNENMAVAVQCTDEDVVVLQKTLDDMVAEITDYALE